MEFWLNNGGNIFAVLGAVLAAALPGIGSAKGVSYAGQGACPITISDPSKFGKTLVLQLLPGTQGLYGMIVAIIVLTTRLGGDPLALDQGIRIFLACLPITLVGYSSAISQGKVAYSGMQILARNEEHFTKGVIYAVMVETYAILSLIISILFLTAA